MICLNCFDVLITDDMDIFMPIDLNINPSEGKHNLVNAFIGVIPKHPIIKYCIDYIVDNVKNDTWWNGDKLPLEFSGPGVFGKAVNKFLNRPERESFLNLEGIFQNQNIKIHFLKFTAQNESNIKSSNRSDHSKEFIKTINEDYIFQNKNGNYLVKLQLENEIKRYNTISWVKYCSLGLNHINTYYGIFVQKIQQ